MAQCARVSSVTKSHGGTTLGTDHAHSRWENVPLSGAEDAQGPPSHFIHRLQPKGFISDKSISPLGASSPKSIPWGSRGTGRCQKDLCEATSSQPPAENPGQGRCPGREWVTGLCWGHCHPALSLDLLSGLLCNSEVPPLLSLPKSFPCKAGWEAQSRLSDCSPVLY